MESVVGSGRTVGVTLQRPNNTTAYAAGAVVADATAGATLLTFTGVGGSARGFTILQDVLVVDSANVATKPDLELWLFDTAPAAQQDAAAFAPTDAELYTGINGLVAVVAIAQANWKVGNAAAGAPGNAVCVASQLGIPLNLGSAGNLYGILVVRNAYVPVALEQFAIRLRLLD